MWADHRALAEAEEITATRHRVLDYLGGTMSPEMELPKLLWLKRHLPQAWARYGLALDLTDYLTWRASGRIAVSACTITCKWTYLNHEDRGLAGGSAGGGRTRRSAEALRNSRSGRRRSAAPRARSPLQAAGDLGLTEECVVGVGLIDAHAGGLGLLGGFATPDLNSRLAMIAGTSTCHMAVSPDARQVPGVWGPYFGAMLPGLWLNEGGQSATGALLDHILDWHAEGRTLAAPRHERVLARIEELHAAEGPGYGARSAVVLPDFHGNRSPLADPLSRGAISGLTLDSSFDSLARLYYATARRDRPRHAARRRRAQRARLRHPAPPPDRRPRREPAAGALCTRTRRTARSSCRDEEDSVLLGTAMAAAAAAGLHGSLVAAGACHGARRTPHRAVARNAGHFADQHRKFLLVHEQQRALRTP